MVNGLLIGALFPLAVGADDSALLCSRRVSRSVRPREVIELTLRATSDSLPDPRRELVDSANTGYGARLYWDTAAVYGQVFERLQVDGTPGIVRWRDHARVVLVWWRDGLQCQRMTPRPAIRRDVEDLFLLARPEGSRWTGGEMHMAIVATLRPESEWLQGMPTVDVTGDAWLYSPMERRPGNLPQGADEAMSIPEYRDFFEHLPQSTRSHQDLESGWRRLLTWGEADPRRWRHYPAAGEPCVAAIIVDAAAATQRRCVR